MSHRCAARSLLSACAALGPGVVGALALHEGAGVVQPVQAELEVVATP